jgi:hypothetical protein
LALFSIGFSVHPILPEIESYTRKFQIFVMSRPDIFLALLWGHIPSGIIRCSRNISRRAERSVPFALSRNQNTGRPALTLINSFGNYHFQSVQGPRPVSLVEIASISPTPIPTEVVSLLHAISVGFPIAGEQLYSANEKFNNPTVPPPSDVRDLQLQMWLGSGGIVISEKLSQNLIDFRR